MFFNKFKIPFQFKFKDRNIAAVALGELLKDNINKEERKDTIILSIPRAGTFTADIVSKSLSIPNFDIILSRKLTDPDNKEQAIGAVIDDGFIFLLNHLIKELQISEDYLEREISFQIQEINYKKRKFYHNFCNKSIYEKIKKVKIILLIDDGIATGSTMSAAVKWIQQLCSNLRIDLKRIIIAAPVAPKNVIEQLRKECNAEVITVLSPSPVHFRSVEQYHKDFEQVNDAQVTKILEKRRMYENS